MREELKEDIKKLTNSGVSILDLYKRFGSIIFRSQILSGQEAIERLTKGKER
jgi:hypothetical protein